jgi:hypothetical protein
MVGMDGPPGLKIDISISERRIDVAARFLNLSHHAGAGAHDIAHIREALDSF